MQRHQTSVWNLYPEQSCEVIYCQTMLFLGICCLTAGFTKLEILFQFLLFCTEKAALPGGRWQLFHLKTGLTFTFFQRRLTCRTCTHVRVQIVGGGILGPQKLFWFQTWKTCASLIRRRASNSWPQPQLIKQFNFFTWFNFENRPHKITLWEEHDWQWSFQDILFQVKIC